MDNGKRKIIIPLFICTLFLGVAISAHAQTAGFEMPGTVSGTGTHFAVTTSQYLNITIDSTESISLYGESVPNSIMLETSSSSVATFTTLTISGLIPSSPYYIHEDNYHNTLQITADANGMLSFPQEIISNHHIFILPHPSTIFLKNDAMGGNCTAVGTWDPLTETCTLTSDISETIEIDDSGITLDGNGHTVQTPDFGVVFAGAQGVTVKNLTINAASKDIFFQTPIGVMTPQTVIENNVLEGTGVGIDPGTSSGVVIESNRSPAIAPGLFFGIHARGQTFQGGFTIVNNSFPVIQGQAIFANLGLSSNLIASNTIGSPQFPHGIAFGGIVVAGSDVTIRDNTVQEVNSAEAGTTALTISDSGNFNNHFTIFHNNFFNNGLNVSGLEVFLSGELSSNSEGNFWGHTSPPCYIASGPDADTDNPLLVDSHPFCQKNGWLAPAGTINILTNNAAATFIITDGLTNTFSGSGISTTFQNVPIGTYTITFGSASGYITPSQQTQTLLAGGTLRFSANYVPILLQVSPSTVFFNYQAGTMPPPPSQSISVTTSTNMSVPTIISVNTTPADGTWFSITSSSGTTPSMLTVGVMTGLHPGTYSGTVTITSIGLLNSPQVIPVTLQVTTPGGPFFSTATWRKLNGSWNSDCDGSFGTIAVDSGNQDTVYIGSSRSSGACGLYKSANNGRTWTAINTGFPQIGIFPFQQYPSVSKIAIAPSDHSVIYVGTIFGDGTFGQILRSNNAGRIWTDASGQSTLGIFAPTINAPVLDISISPTDASIVFAGLSKAGIFKTQDSGKDWTLVRGGTLVEGEADNFYVVRFAQSNLSMAYGAGFTAFSGSLFPCIISEGGGGDCVDFEGDVPFFPFILTDENGGTLFSALPYPATIFGNGPLITDLAIDPSDSNTVYVSTIAYAALSGIIPAPVPNLGVFKTEDGGLHWKPVNGSSDLDVSQFPLFRLVMDPTDPHTLYAVAGSSGIFVTTNGGENWKRVSMNGLSTGTFIGNLALGNDRRLYALTSSGVYVLGN